MQLSFDNRTYLITGGGSGIGKGVAAALVASGANVMLMGRTAARLAAAAEEIRAGGSGEVNCEVADITNEDDVARVVDAVVAWKGKLDGVVNSAGGSNTVGPITQIDSELWRGVIDLNVNGMMYVLKHSARAMVRGGGGSFIGISSIAASNTHRWFGAYGPAKSAVDHMVKLAADELGISGVRVNGIRPGLIRTELTEAVLMSPEVSADYQACTPLQRIGEVEDVADVALFLLSDASSYVTGQIINVDGGMQVRRGPDYSAMFEPLFGADALRGVV